MLDKSNSDGGTQALSHWSKVRSTVFRKNQDLVEWTKSFPINPLGWRAQYKHKEPLMLQEGMICCFLKFLTYFVPVLPLDFSFSKYFSSLSVKMWKTLKKAKSCMNRCIDVIEKHYRNVFCHLVDLRLMHCKHFR